MALIRKTAWTASKGSCVAPVLHARAFVAPHAVIMTKREASKPQSRAGAPSRSSRLFLLSLTNGKQLKECSSGQLYEFAWDDVL